MLFSPHTEVGEYTPVLKTHRSTSLLFHIWFLVSFAVNYIFTVYEVQLSVCKKSIFFFLNRKMRLYMVACQLAERNQPIKICYLNFRFVLV